MDRNEKDKLHQTICLLQNGIIGFIVIVFGMLIFTCLREVSQGLQYIRHNLAILQNMEEELELHNDLIEPIKLEKL